MHLAPRHQDTACFQTVDPAKLNRVHIDIASQFIDALLQSGVHFGHSKPAHWTTYGMIGVHAVTIGFYIGDFIGSTAAVAAGSGDVDSIFCVCSGVPEKFVLHSQEATVRVAAHLKICHQSLAHKSGVKLLLTRQQQFHRASLYLRSDHHCQGFHADTRFAAETSTHIRCNYPHIALRYA